jgi:FKBP-type peptidyl-prolyl cis-trans isomerase
MKNYFFLGLLAALPLMSNTVSAAKPETEAQKLGYIIGMDIGASLKQQGSDIDLDTLFEAIKTTYEDGEPAISAEEATAIREEFIATRRAEADADKQSLSSENSAEGDKFLLENRVKEGVMITDSGLQYEVLEMGDGPKPQSTDKVEVHYRGTLLNGEEFDSSYARGEPISFELDKVIAGWTEGVQLMPVGSKFMFYIPPGLAYGPAGGGPIGPNATLIFQVELLSIQ